MLLRTGFFRGLAAAVIAVSMATFAFGDTIRLKDGSIIKGKIVSFTGGTFIVTVGEGARARRLTFPAAEVDSIQFDSPMSEPAVSRRNEIPTVIITNDPKPSNETTAANTTPSPTPAEIVTQPANYDPQPDEPDGETNAETKAEETATEPAEPVTTASSEIPDPIGISVKVLADNTANGWTNTGWIVRKGQRIRIIGNGSVSLGNGVTTSPAGLSDVEDETKLLRSVPTGALIAVIGDDNNDFIYIGAERTFTAARDGALFLGLNEGNLNDNTGEFDVRVEIDPGTE